jgi:phospholipid/cholesterol/gamma-HCH transport system substrate-binding protein
MNNGNGALARLVRDDKMAASVSNTLSNLENGTKGFSENMEAAKSNFLFRGYFKKKEKQKEKQAEEAKEKKEDQAEKAAKEKEAKEKEAKEKEDKAKEEKQKEEDAKKAAEKAKS